MDKLAIILSLVCYMTSCAAVSYRQYNFTDKDIRLVGGYSELEGRVEIRKHGVWGTVCYNAFDLNDGNVLCRMLHNNLSAIEYYTDGRYGEGPGPIFYTYLTCSGSEESVDHCSQSSASCKHSQDVGLMCVGCPSASVETQYGVLEHVNITNLGDVYSGPCMKGLSSQEFMFTCLPYGAWVEHINQCTNTVISDIRLTDRSAYYMEGYVDALVGNTWLPLCGYTTINRRSYYFDNAQTSMVLCSMLGQNFKHSLYDRSTKVIRSPGVILSKCFGNETTIRECKHFTGYTCQYQVWIRCTVNELDIKAMRLANGSSPYDGRIELYLNNVIGTVCLDGFDYNDATVVCRMLGLSFSSFYGDSVQHTDGRYAMVKNLACNGNENHINNCSYSIPYSDSECLHKQTRVLCVECGRLDIRHGTVQSFDYNTNTVTVRCHTDNPRTVQFICNRNGTWTNTDLCKPIVIQDIRLVGENSTLMAGTVELKINNLWGTICDNGFGYNEAKVMCRMLNYSAAWSYYVQNAGYGQGSGLVHMNILSCNGSESDINQCSFNMDTACSHADDVGVACSYYERVKFNGIRMVNGSSRFNGVVQLLYDGVWRSLCQMLRQPNSSCRLMNMTYIKYRCCFKPPKGHDMVFVDRAICPSTVSHVTECYFDYRPNRHLLYVRNGYCSRVNVLVCSECPTLNVSNGNLEYSEDGTTATLTCFPGHISNTTFFICNEGRWSNNHIQCYPSPPLNITRVRLTDGPNSNMGRLEIAVKNAYGTICAKEFSYIDGDIACKSLSTRYRAAAVYDVSYFGQGTGPIYIDQLDCTFDREHIKDCAYKTTGLCNHTQDVSLVCNECGKPVTYWDEGMLKFEDSNGIMYGDCSFYPSYIGQLHLVCDNGTWKTNGKCLEYSKPLEVQNIRLVNGSTLADGRVEFKVFDTWGTICSDHFGTKEAEVVCRMMGYLHAHSFSVNGSYGIGVGPIFIDDLNCGDDASHINDCEYTTVHNCSHAQDVAVTCTDCGSVDIHEGRIISSPVITTVNATLKFDCNDGFEMNGADTISCESSGQWSSSPPLCRQKSNLPVVLGVSISLGSLVVMTTIALSVYCIMRRRHLKLSNIVSTSKDQRVTRNPNTYQSPANSWGAGADRVYVNSAMDTSTENYYEMDAVTHSDRMPDSERQNSANTTVYEQLSGAKKTTRLDE